MRSSMTLLIRCSLILLPTAALAHDTLPKDWCVDDHSTAVVAREFHLDEAELMARVREFERTHDHSQKPAKPGVFDARCGIVDLWSWADLLAAGYCAENVEEALAMPLITGPQSFLSQTHHAEYHFGEGLSGVCAVCKSSQEQ